MSTTTFKYTKRIHVKSIGHNEDTLLFHARFYVLVSLRHYLCISMTKLIDFKWSIQGPGSRLNVSFKTAMLFSINDQYVKDFAKKNKECLKNSITN